MSDPTLPDPTLSGPTLSDLRARPDFLPVVADRLWRAWWRAEGLSLAGMEALVGESLCVEPLPLTLVAHRGEVFLGTASVVADDLKARPAYTPWLAAVFVEPEARGAGLASLLVREATARAFRLPVERLYLNAVPAVAPLYERLGWSLVEPDVGGLRIYALENPDR